MYNPQMTVDRIKKLRTDKGISSNELNERCELNKNTIKTSGSSKNGLSAKLLCSISDCLECSVDYLLGRDSFAAKKSPPSEMTENEYEMLKAFKDLTPTQQGKLIERAKIMSEQNEAEFQRKESV